MTTTLVLVALFIICAAIAVAAIVRRYRFSKGSAIVRPEFRPLEPQRIRKAASDTAAERGLESLETPPPTETAASDKAVQPLPEALRQQGQPEPSAAAQVAPATPAEEARPVIETSAEEESASLLDRTGVLAQVEHLTPEELSAADTPAAVADFKGAEPEPSVSAAQETAADEAVTREQADAETRRQVAPGMHSAPAGIDSTSAAAEVIPTAELSSETEAVTPREAIAAAEPDLASTEPDAAVGLPPTQDLSRADETHLKAAESPAAQSPDAEFQVTVPEPPVAAQPKAAAAETATTEQAEAETQEEVTSGAHPESPAIDSDSVEPIPAPAQSSDAQTFTSRESFADAEIPEIESASEVESARPIAPEADAVSTTPAPAEAVPVDHPLAPPSAELDETVEPLDIETAGPDEIEPGGESADELVGQGARTPRQYRPRIAASPTQPRERQTQPARATQERALGLTVRVLFERDGWCKASIIPERTDTMPEAVEVSGSLGSYQFAKLQDDCYGDFAPENIGSALRAGIELEQKGKRSTHWSLSGREIFVLAPSSKLRGFLSVPRLMISEEEQLVLCAEERSAEAEQVLREIGCDNYTRLDTTTGIPDGWVLWRGVRPKLFRAVSGSILDVLCPEPAIDIVLEGGIRLQRLEWLAGFPPEVRVRGDVVAPVLIDGREAEKRSNGVYVTPDAHKPGQHVVSCAGVSRGYSLVEPAQVWEPWPAYCFQIGEKSKGSAICGAAILTAESCASDQAFWVPSAYPVLLGANPGEVVVGQHRTDVTTGRWPVSISFEPVWAVPYDSLHVDKRSYRVLLIGEPKPPASVSRRSRASAAERRWASEILNAGRKGLSVEPADPELEDLWRAYRRTAKAIWRALR